MQCRNVAMRAALVALLMIVNGRLTGADETAGVGPSPQKSDKMTDLPVPKKLAADALINVLGLPTGAVSAGGSLMICGGGSLPEEVYDEFVRLAGGERSRLVLIPSAHPYEDQDELACRFNGWRQYPVNSFGFLHTTSRAEAETEEFARPLAEATGVWFSGGAQGRLADLYKGTRVEQHLQRVLERGGVIGGTSAGAAIMSQTMIREGTSRQAVTDSGLNLLSSAIIDQHFTERSRHTRLLGALGQNPAMIGLGVDENTALIVRANTVRVMGENRATVIVPAQNRTMSLHLLANGEEAELTRGADRADGPLRLLQTNLAKVER